MGPLLLLVGVLVAASSHDPLAIGLGILAVLVSTRLPW